MSREISTIRDKYNPLLGELVTPITIKDLRDNGWVRSGFYPAGDCDLFKKGDIEIRVGFKKIPNDDKYKPRKKTNKIIYCMTYWDSVTRFFVDIGDLELYYMEKNEKD